MSIIPFLCASFGSDGLIHLLGGLLVLAVVIWVTFLILGMLKIPEPLKTIIGLILSLIFLLILLQRVGIAF